jgi:predicted nucleic-acid-binding Zn-ribbon protein
MNKIVIKLNKQISSINKITNNKYVRKEKYIMNKTKNKLMKIGMKKFFVIYVDVMYQKEIYRRI